MLYCLKLLLRYLYLGNNEVGTSILHLVHLGNTTLHSTVIEEFEIMLCIAKLALDSRG